MNLRIAAALAVVGMVVGSAIPARAADVRIGYIDSSKIFQQYKAAQEAQQRFDRQVQNWRDEAAEKQKGVDQLRAELRSQGPILSSLKRQEREAALQKAVDEYERFIQDVWGPTGRAAQENDRNTREIVERIRTAVEKIAGDKGLDLVLDAAGGYIVFADRSLDMTGPVVEELNAREAAGAAR